MIAPRRFWTEVSVEAEPDGFGLRLDGQPLLTPAQAVLRLPSRKLAEAVAAEWRAVDGEIRPESMHFTRAANAAIDRVAPDPGPVIEMIASYGETDLLCYRAAAPKGLRRRQAEGWDPILAWSEATLKAPLYAVDGVIPVPQPATSLSALRDAVAAFGPFQLTALHQLVALSGSLLLGLAVARNLVSADAAWSLSRIDETWQAEQWGEDDEAAAAALERRLDFLRSAYLLEMLA